MFEYRFDLNIFFKDMDTVESLPRDRVLDFLLKNKQVSFSTAGLIYDLFVLCKVKVQ